MATARSMRHVPYDPTVYPSEDHRGEGSLQRFISELLRALIEQYLIERGQTAFVGANQFIYYRQFDPSRKVAPDVFTLPGVEPGIKIDSWKTWEKGIVPPLAIEIVSQDFLKDYRDGPAIYDELGVRELIIFDPEHESAPSERLRFQVYRRLAKRGLVRVEATNEDRILSRVLGCRLRSIGDSPEMVRLRIATGPAGDDLFPTEAERARAEADSVRAALAEAEVENRRLRAEIERLRRKR